MSVLSLLFQSSSGPVVGFCLEKMLVPKRNIKARWQRVGCWYILYLLLGIFKVWLSSMTALLVLDILTLGASFWLVQVLYEGTKKEKRLALASLIVAQILSEGIYSLLLAPEPVAVLDFTRPEMAMGSAITALIGLLLQWGVCEGWCRLRQKGKVIRFPALFAVFLMAELMPLLLLYHNETDAYSEEFRRYLLFYTCVLFGAFCLAYILFNQAEKEQMEQELHQVRDLSQRERQHYASIEERREEMAKIRHDYSNLTASVLRLLQDGAVEEAKDLLQELSTRIQSTKEYPYCGIPIVNAVLEEKKQQCDRLHVAFRAELLLPDQLPISHLDLCSALGNLLDNAIRACRQIETGRPGITLMAGLVSGYLVIKCQNPSPKAPGEKPDGTGYGFKILSDIAARYQGDFFTEYRGGAFTAQLSLFLPRGEKASKLP